MTSGLRSTLAALLLSLGLFLPGTASGLAILHISESSVRQSGNPPAALGYFERADPDLEFWNTQETPRGPHVVGGVEHSDSLFTHSARYRDLVSVNNQRILFGAVEGPLDPGHSRARASGFADAADRTLGGYARTSGEATAGAQTSVEMHYTITVGPGASGFALGAPVEGLRFEFDADGFLRVGAKTFPHSSGVGAGAGVSAWVFRQHGAICIPPNIECQTNAVAAGLSMDAGAGASAVNPDEAGDPTGIVNTSFSWTAMNNTGVFKGGGVFSRGKIESSVPRFGEDADISEVVPFDLDQLPFGFIEFNAMVGEILRFEVDLDLGAGGADGFAEADFFNTFSSSVVDPLGRGFQIVHQFAPAEPPPPPPPPIGVPGPATLFLWGIGLAALAAYKRRSGRP